MRTNLLAIAAVALFIAGCTPVGMIPPQDPNLDAEPRTMMLSEMAAELGWTYERGVPGPRQYQMRSPQGDLVTFTAESDLVIMNSTRWRQERDAVANRIGSDLLLPESTFNFICKRFEQHHLVRNPIRRSSYAMRPIDGTRPAPAQPAPKAPSDDRLKGLIICVDAGHGGRDPGGIANGVRESDVCLAVSLILQELLEDAGATVLMTRTEDVYPTLDDRCWLANENNAHLFVSIHANIAPNSDQVQGFEIFYKGGNAECERLARTLIDAMDAVTDSPNRGAKVDPRGLRVLENTDMPAVLVELGFLSNAYEARRLTTPSYQKLLAQALLDGIVTHWAQSRARVSR
jgi:N-acetylmuramoyl-L-alanine amidase